MTSAQKIFFLITKNKYVWSLKSRTKIELQREICQICNILSDLSDFQVLDLSDLLISAIWKKTVDRQTDGSTDGRTDGRTEPLIEERQRI